jgi:hypothetical protein
MRITFLICMFCLTFFARAGEHDTLLKLVDDLNRVNVNRENLAFNLTYKLYTNGVLDAPFILQGQLIQRGPLRYSSMGELESFRNREHVVSVDREEKVVLLSPNNGGVKEPFDPSQLKRYMEGYSSYRIVVINDKLWKLRLEMKVGEIAAVDIYYHPLTFAIAQVSFDYRKLPAEEDDEAGSKRLDILFRLNTAASAADPRLRINHYCTYRNGAWRAAPAFAHYEFISNVNGK